MLAGNMLELLLSKEYGEHEFQWQEKYGPVYSIKGCFGESAFLGISQSSYLLQ
jgi:hypothetical protein